MRCGFRWGTGVETFDVANSPISTGGPTALLMAWNSRRSHRGVARGIDMFDCVMPTRNARNGCVFTSEGKLVIKNARYAKDERPLDPQCGCAVCRRHSRAYIRHLFVAREMLGGMLATHHNLYFYLDCMHKVRQAIRSGTFGELRSRVRAGS
jgi:queuine tRNA-ribosyltransferase